MTTRRIDLDWIRILAFGLLILYHVGMFYVDWDWHVKSPHATAALEPAMMLTSPWRLGLLFFVAGCAAAFWLRRADASPGALLSERTRRLLIPLAFGIWVVVPPQSWLEVVEKLRYGGTYLDFWLHRYATGYGGFCREDCLRIPTWNHLWFVAYLWVYAALLALALKVAPRAIDALREAAARHLHGARAFIVPAATLAVARETLAPHFPATHALVDDWYDHAQYFFLFALGVLVAEAPRFWATLARARWIALAFAVLAWAAIAGYFARYGASADEPPQALRLVMRAVYGWDQWLAPAAALGFARHLRPADSPLRRYLTEAVFPFYIVHQTAIVVLAHFLQPLAIRPALEAPLLVAATVATCLASFEIVRRVEPLRPLFGLAPNRRTAVQATGTDGPGLPPREGRSTGAIIAG